MKPMPLTFVKNTFAYEQALRSGQIAIYKQRLNATADKPVRGCLAYEVIKIQQIPAGEMFGRPIEAHETGPSNESWGTLGWTYPDLEHAKAKFHALVAAAEQPAKPKKGAK
jgi:hypothetical protein